MEEIKTAHEFIVDLWQFMKSHYYVSTDFTYWEGVINDSNILLAKYKSKKRYRLFKRIVFAVIDEWEEQRQELEKGQEE